MRYNKPESKKELLLQPPPVTVWVLRRELALTGRDREPRLLPYDFESSVSF